MFVMSPITTKCGRDEYMFARFSMSSEAVQMLLHTMIGRRPFQSVIMGLLYCWDIFSHSIQGLTLGMLKKLPTMGNGNGPGGILRRKSSIWT
jgi:hypothetical protein